MPELQGSALASDGEAGSDVKILIAEDDAISRRLLETILRKWGYEVVSPSTAARRGRELQKEDAPRLAILDWMMPEMDGVEVCGKGARARERSRTCTSCCSRPRASGRTW